MYAYFNVWQIKSFLTLLSEQTELYRWLSQYLQPQQNNVWVHPCKDFPERILQTDIRYGEPRLNQKGILIDFMFCMKWTASLGTQTGL